MKVSVDRILWQFPTTPPPDSFPRSDIFPGGRAKKKPEQFPNLHPGNSRIKLEVAFRIRLGPWQESSPISPQCLRIGGACRGGVRVVTMRESGSSGGKRAVGEGHYGVRDRRGRQALGRLVAPGRTQGKKYAVCARIRTFQNGTYEKGVRVEKVGTSHEFPNLELFH